MMVSSILRVISIVERLDKNIKISHHGDVFLSNLVSLLTFLYVITDFSHFFHCHHIPEKGNQLRKGYFGGRVIWSGESAILISQSASFH